MKQQSYLNFPKSASLLCLQASFPLTMLDCLEMYSRHPVSCIEPRLAIHFLYDIIHVSMPFSQIITPSPSPTESERLFYTSVSLLLSRIQGYRYHLSKFHICAFVYYIGVFLSGLPHSILYTSYNRLQFHPPH